ncbi:hypothetical protein Rhopal_003079-T1 [Rhodotorula paludigena]|uniref:Xylanolytic transcriptional activator regulatory domain-containing protein n=1 Tax=Rhodotorula paludigena TaxID=86838 RepID=A0AAV5GC83_9BASI|nr:hypothetical protein Rhopal_003079-T1 [Rhodotorula paludigena]
MPVRVTTQDESDLSQSKAAAELAAIQQGLVEIGTSWVNATADETHKLYEAAYARLLPSWQNSVVQNVQYGPDERHILDVYLPTPSQEKPPVLVFLHGGGFFSGDKQWTRAAYSNIGHYLASNGIVGVMANYRLVKEGGVCYPGGGDDVELIRQWVHENIGRSDFGAGDPNRVVLSGQSSGAAHVATNTLDALALPTLITIGQLDTKEITDANIDFFNTYRAKSLPLGAMPRFQVVPGHNHISNVLSIGTEDDLQGKMLVDFIREVKCDGLAPCGHCTSFGETCLFEEDTNSTRRSHLEALQARVLQQELRLQKIEALLGEKGLAVPTRPETDGSAAPTRPAYLPDPPPPEQETEESPAPEVFPTFADDDADERSWRGKVGRLVVDARANARYIAASGAAQPQTLSNLSWLTSPLGLKLSPALPSLAAVERPDRELSDLLVEQYFDRLHLLVPILHKPSFLKLYQSFWLRPLQELRPMSLAMIFSVLACAAAITDDPRVKHAQGSFAFGPSFQIVPEPGSDGSGRAGVGLYAQANLLAMHGVIDQSLEQVQVYGLFTLFLCISNAPARAWIVLGQAIRFATDLGLHRSLDRSILPRLQKEKRRRTFWSLYALDRSLAAILGRPLTLNDADIDAEKPLECSDELLEALCESQGSPASEQLSNMSGFNYLIDLHRLTGKALGTISTHSRASADLSPEAAETRLREQIGRYEKDLQAWVSRLPAHLQGDLLQLPPPYLIQRLIAFSSFYSTTLLLHFPLLPQQGSTPSLAQQLSLSLVALAPSLVAAKIPPSLYLLDFTQHLLVAGGFLLLILQGGLDDAVVVDQLRSEVSQALQALVLLESTRFAGVRAARTMLERLAAATLQGYDQAPSPESRLAAAFAAPSLPYDPFLPFTNPLPLSRAAPNVATIVPPPVDDRLISGTANDGDDLLDFLGRFDGNFAFPTGEAGFADSYLGMGAMGSWMSS